MSAHFPPLSILNRTVSLLICRCFHIWTTQSLSLYVLKISSIFLNGCISVLWNNLLSSAILYMHVHSLNIFTHIIFYCKILLRFVFLLRMYVWDVWLPEFLWGSEDNLQDSIFSFCPEFWDSNSGPQHCLQVPWLTGLCYLSLAPLSGVHVLFLSHHLPVFVSLLISRFHIWERMNCTCISESDYSLL